MLRTHWFIRVTTYAVDIRPAKPQENGLELSRCCRVALGFHPGDLMLAWRPSTQTFRLRAAGSLAFAEGLQRAGSREQGL